MARIRIGISGWRYAPWRGEFYPPTLPQRRELEYVGALLNSVEINGSFYSLQSAASYRRWAAAVPKDFVFAVKGPRYVTHVLRLRHVETALANFFASGVLELGTKLGPFLWQLPPRMAYEPDHVERFCALLPKHVDASVALARHHDHRVPPPGAWPSGRRRLRHAFEPRDPRFMQPHFIRTLRRHGHALVFADTADKHPYAEDLTAGFVYVRLHGAEELYSSGYSAAELDTWARRIGRWRVGDEDPDARRVANLKSPARRGRDVYVYFDNDIKVHAPFDAIALARRLERGPEVVARCAVAGIDPPPRLVKGTPG